MMTSKRVAKAMHGRKYAILRFENGFEVAVNCGIATLSRSRKAIKGEKLLQVVSVRPCNFQEYISKKAPFIT